MWKRQVLKTNAKAALKGHYWLAFLVSFLAMVIITGSLLGSGTSQTTNSDSCFWVQHEIIEGITLETTTEITSDGPIKLGCENFESAISDLLNDAELPSVFPSVGAFIAALVFMGIIGLLALLFMIAYHIFISNPVIVGQKKFYLDNRKGKTEAGKLLSSFSIEYKNIVKVMFLKNLRIFLWSLLLIIPGIIKAIQYMAVDYLLAEYPKMELCRVLKLSSEITNGQKWKIFKLGLSFFGWVLLCIITGGIGFVFLTPYIQATFAELYTFLIEKSLSESLIDTAETPVVLPAK